MKEKDIIKGMSLEEKIAKAEELAKGYFKNGLNCAECVLKTYMDMYDTGMPEEAICMASGFGGGIGHTKSVCGAVSGAVMALGLDKGRKDPDGPREEMRERIDHLYKNIYPEFASLLDDVKDEYGTIICSEMSQQFEDFESKPRMRNCMKITMDCAALAVKHTEEA